MKKYIVFPLLVYVIVCFIAVFIPTSEDYNVISWKLFIGQIYAIPAFLIAALISYFSYKKGFSSQ